MIMIKKLSIFLTGMLISFSILSCSGPEIKQDKAPQIKENADQSFQGLQQEENQQK
jgi:hypothetical protein